MPSSSAACRGAKPTAHSSRRCQSRCKRRYGSWKFCFRTRVCTDVRLLCLQPPAQQRVQALLHRQHRQRLGLCSGALRELRIAPPHEELHSSVERLECKVHRLGICYMLLVTSSTKASCTIALSTTQCERFYAEVCMQAAVGWKCCNRSILVRLHAQGQASNLDKVCAALVQ